MKTCDFCGERRETRLYRDGDGDVWVACATCVAYERSVAAEQHDPNPLIEVES